MSSSRPLSPRVPLAGSFLLLAALVAACGDPTPPRPSRRPPGSPRVLVLWLEGLRPDEFPLESEDMDGVPGLRAALSGARVHEEAIAPSDHGDTARRSLLLGLPPLPGARGGASPRGTSLPAWLARHGASGLLVSEGSPSPDDLPEDFAAVVPLAPHALEGREGLEALRRALSREESAFVLVRCRASAFPVDLRRPRNYPPRWDDVGSATLLERLAFDEAEGERLLAWARSSSPGKAYQVRRTLEYLTAGPEFVRKAWADFPFLRTLGERIRSDPPSRPGVLFLEALRTHRMTEGRRAIHLVPRIVALLDELGLGETTHVIVMSPAAVDRGSLLRGAWLPGDLAEGKLRVPLLHLRPLPPRPEGDRGLPPMAPRPPVRIPSPVSTLGLAATVCELLAVPAHPGWAVPSFDAQLLGGQETPIVAAHGAGLVVRTSADRLLLVDGSMSHQLVGPIGSTALPSPAPRLRVQALRNAAWQLYDDVARRLAPDEGGRAYGAFARELLRMPMDGAVTTGKK